MDQTTIRRRNAEQEALRILNNAWGSIMGNRASYHYYAPSDPLNKSRAQDRYFYTATKVEHGNRIVFLSGVYRYNASKRIWKATKKAGHRTKHQAIERARKLAKENA